MKYSFEIMLSNSGGDEICNVEIQAVATVYPYQPQTSRSYASGGEPSEEGHAEITALQFYDDKRNVTRDVSDLLHILPQSFVDELETKIYEDRATEAADRTDWERDQMRDQEVTKQRFKMIVGAAG